VVLLVKRATITGKLLSVIVDRIDQVLLRDARLGVEDQVVPSFRNSSGSAATALARTSSRHLHSFSCWYAFAAVRFSALVMPASKRPRHRDANYQSVGTGNGVVPPAVAGVKKSADNSSKARA
jgi:hypothetical protein